MAHDSWLKAHGQEKKARALLGRASAFLMVGNSPTRLALGFLQFRIDIGCGLTGTLFQRDLAAVPSVVETGSP